MKLILLKKKRVKDIYNRYSIRNRAEIARAYLQRNLYEEKEIPAQEEANEKGLFTKEQIIKGGIQAA
jgi:hypothetical protein